MNEREVEDSATVMLREIVSLWPKSDNSDFGASASDLAPYLSKAFNPIDFFNGIEAITHIKSVDQQPNQHVQIEFVDNNGFAQRATFKIGKSGRLRLESLKMECPACFGEGEDNGDTCPICGGSGWGIS